MGLVNIDWSPGPRGLRQFGVGVLVGSVAVGGLLYWRGHGDAGLGLMCAGGLAAALAFTGTRVALHVMTRLLLGVAYFGVITPMGLIMRGSGRDRLGLRRRSDSYWRPVPPGSGDYERQF